MKPFLPALLSFAFIVLAVSLHSSCLPVPPPSFDHGSHGFRLWSGATIQSFVHQGATCIPAGFEPIGHQVLGPGWALYPQGRTGVIIRSDAFAARALSFEESSYAVTLRYPADTESELVDEYERMTRNAFEKVGALYADGDRAVRPHTVLVTAGIPYSPSPAASIYPDPGPDVTYLILEPSEWRGEDLLIHGVMHLYNRERKDLTHYLKTQSIPASDFHELEAAWAETALNPSADKRTWRLEYLLNVHQAVVRNEFARITHPPFNNESAFNEMTPGVVTGVNSTYLDMQYGHYVLGPLLMVSIDGLLYENEAGMDVATLLTKLHTGEIENFFETVASLLPEEDAKRINRFMHGEEEIPSDLVLSASSRY